MVTLFKPIKCDKRPPYTTQWVLVPYGTKETACPGGNKPHYRTREEAREAALAANIQELARKVDETLTRHAKDHRKQRR